MAIFNDIFQIITNDDSIFHTRSLPIDKQASEYYRSLYKSSLCKCKDSNMIATLVGEMTLPIPDGMSFQSNSSLPNPKNKFQQMYDIIHNPYTTNKNHDEFLQKFNCAQRLYHILNRFAYRYKWNRAPMANSMDLLLNPISETQKNLIYLMQDNKKYVLTVLDITSIIDTALTNSPYIYAEPIVSRNPYNNVPFTKANLYNIYFQIKHGCCVMSPFLHKYFLSNFHLKIFRDTNEAFIRSAHIKQFVNSNDHDKLYGEILNMIAYYNKSVPRRLHLNIHAEFPKDTLLHILKPYLKLYYTRCYSLDISEKHETDHEFKYRMNKFALYNPAFGRKIQKTETIGLMQKTITRKYVFNDKYLPWSRPTYAKNYDTCHLEIIEDEYEEATTNQSVIRIISAYVEDEDESVIEEEDAAILVDSDDEEEEDTLVDSDDEEEEDTLVDSDDEEETFDEDAAILVDSDDDLDTIEITLREPRTSEPGTSSINNQVDFDSIFGEDTDSGEDEDNYHIELENLANMRTIIDDVIGRINDINLAD